MKEPVLKTKQLMIYPEKNGEGNTEEKDFSAFFKAPWKICLKGSNEEIGSFLFRGPVEDHAVEIDFETEPEYWNRGYMSEAIPAILDYAFSVESELYFVEAVVQPDNLAALRVLEKTGFVFDEVQDLEVERHLVKERTLTQWMPIYMCFGVSIGTALGVSMKNYAIGMCMGIAFGVLIGAILDNQARKKQEAVRTARKEYLENKTE